MKDRAGVVIKKNNEDKILIIRRVRNGNKYYVFPGGTIEGDESAEEAAAREAMEELSLKVQIGAKIAQFINQGREETYFLVEKYSGNLALGGEEKDNMHAGNQYHLEWKNREEFIQTEPFYPREVKERVVTSWIGVRAQ